MKSHTFVLVIVSCFALVSSAWAQPSGQKSGGKKGPSQRSEADTALEAFGKAVAETAAKPSQAGFQNVIVAGMKVLSDFPTHNRVNDVLRDLSTFGSAMREKSVAHLRPVYVSQLKYEIVNHRYKEGLSDDAKAAVAALDAAVADYELRESTRLNFEPVREKIDALAKLPAAGRFLRAREQSYVEALTLGVSAARGEAHLKTLVEHPVKDVADWAKEELSLVEIRKQPFDLKFTGLDGKPFDMAQHRGKNVVALVFWSNANQGSTRELLSLQEAYNNYRKRGFEIVTVACDKAEDREKVAKFAKDNRVAWPVHFDGTELQNEVGKKLLVKRVPAIALFNKEGILVANNLRANRVGSEVARLLGVKEVARAEAPREEMGGGGGGGGNRRRN